VASDLEHPDFPTLCKHLSEHRVRYLVIGGWAAIAHGLPRTTLDVDLFVDPSRDNVERLIEALSKVGFGTAKELDADEILSRHVLLFADRIRVDVFTKPWGLAGFKECRRNRKEVEFESTSIPFLGLEDLIRSKSTDRAQDESDVRALREIARRNRS
jgi:hypothetical protein